MDEIRHWWGTALKRFFGWVGSLWASFARGITEQWDVGYFVLAAVVFVIFGLFSMMRRGN